VWNQLQEEEKGLSSQSRRIIAKGSGHYIQMDSADLVIKELTSFVLMIRNRESFPGNQSTTEE
jgi:hypothetical protein